MPVMSRIEQAFCRSLPWRRFSRRVVVPWALHGRVLQGEVLELGSGSGAMAEGLLEQYPIMKLTATDVDPRMVAAAERRLARFVPRATARRIDATSLPFEDGQFDAAVSFLMLHHVIDWEDAIRETLRVLRPGGSFIGYDLVDSFPARIVHSLDRSPHRLAHAQAIRSELEANGTVDISVVQGFGGLVVRFRASKPPARAATYDGP